MSKNKIISIIGGGASSLLAADILSEQFEVHIYEKGKSIGRKFLVAGNGGFNLTHDVSPNKLIEYYTPSNILKTALLDFDVEATQKWLFEIGIETYVGSSGRIFPIKGIKPALVLKKIKDRLKSKQVQFHYFHEFIGFNEELNPIIKNEEKEFILENHPIIFSLGGASWSKTGSDGKWLDLFQEKNIKCHPFQASNCGLNIDWKKDFIEKYEGTPLKNIAISINDTIQKGEALITEYGIEGNAIYPIIPYIRNAIEHQELNLTIDFKPNNSLPSLINKIHGNNIKPKNYTYIFNLSKCELSIIKNQCSKEEYLNPKLFAKAIKNCNIPIESLRPIEESISTIGGVDFQEVDTYFRLKKKENIYLMGEMLNWDAPTGGFLLQGCFSMSNHVAQHIIKNG